MGKKARTAITPTRAENFPEWYQQVIKAAEMAENSPVRGCMIIKPQGYALWENMQRTFDDMIKEAGVDNVYFPLLIPLEFMSREAEHVEGFAKECAVVTHHRLEQSEDGLIPAGKLEEPYIIRPTSETIIGDAMARWIQSYRDLPMKLNQWCNVMRWEMRTRIFLRTSEFLWQEGHNAFETGKEANDDALKMLEAYREFSEDYLAMPVITGEKTIEERFPGADNTYTIESMMQDGKALQAGTSHNLGQNFSKSIGIKFQGRDGSDEFVYTTSWGCSTRLVGGMIMTHADDDGMIMPPRVAPHQVIVIPIVREGQDASVLNEYVDDLRKQLKANGIRVRIDDREMRTPDKMWDSIKKGVPVRVEVGMREVEEGTLTYVRRDLGKSSKTTCPMAEFVSSIQGVLNELHDALFASAVAFREEHSSKAVDLAGLKEFFDKDNIGFVHVPVSVMEEDGYDAVMKEHSLTTRCMPFADDGKIVIIGKAY